MPSVLGKLVEQGQHEIPSPVSWKTTLTSLCAGIAAATIFSPSRDVVVSQSQLRVAFDGDAVLFSDESERIVKAHGLDRFFEHEKAHENKPLAQVLRIPRTPE